ncbi:MAG: hypothetical protein FJW39_00320 [Acidobacteria bacterium]|nr:hypothetical protein [Acidobacteriota bacterium]
MPVLFWLALSTFASEDLACIAAGTLIAQGSIGFWQGALACLAGIFAGDVMLMISGRVLGARVAGRLAPPEKLAEASSWISRRGLVVALASRFTPGTRLATYLAAGVLRVNPWKFSAYLLLAAALWTPPLVWISSRLGEQVLRGTVRAATISVVAAAALLLVARVALDFRRRRRFVGRLLRVIRWEFWPAWIAYLPLIPYLLYLACKHRSLTLFTAANPGIESGGFVGESKSRILSQLDVCAGAVASFRTFESASDLVNPFGFPVVIKPDIGERGAGVVIARSDEQLREAAASMHGRFILQQYVPGIEFGVFYYRYPDEERGRVFSITAKHSPSVTGDGHRTVEELILADTRAVCLAGAYLAANSDIAQTTPPNGGRIQLVEIGSHCRGSVFLDGTALLTPAIEQRIEEISRAHSGFYFGRYDVRAESVEAFQRGDFLVIELNGVSSEATHIYDPRVPVWQAYRTMFHLWRTAFQIGAANRRLGASPCCILALRKTLYPRISFLPGFRRGAVGAPRANDAGPDARPRGGFRDWRTRSRSADHGHIGRAQRSRAGEYVTSRIL